MFYFDGQVGLFDFLFELIGHHQARSHPGFTGDDDFLNFISKQLILP